MNNISLDWIYLIVRLLNCRGEFDSYNLLQVGRLNEWWIWDDVQEFRFIFEVSIRISVPPCV